MSKLAVDFSSGFALPFRTGDRLRQDELGLPRKAPENTKSAAVVSQFECCLTTVRLLSRPTSKSDLNLLLWHSVRKPATKKSMICLLVICVRPNLTRCHAFRIFRRPSGLRWFATCWLRRSRRSDQCDFDRLQPRSWFRHPGIPRPDRGLHRPLRS